MGRRTSPSAGLRVFEGKNFSVFATGDCFRYCKRHFGLLFPDIFSNASEAPPQRYKNEQQHGIFHMITMQCSKKPKVPQCFWRLSSDVAPIPASAGWHHHTLRSSTGRLPFLAFPCLYFGTLTCRFGCKGRSNGAV